MINTLSHFFHMGGYAFYVWVSYGSVLALLGIQWLIPWRRFKKYTREQS